MSAPKKSKKPVVITLKGVVFEGKKIPAFTEIECTIVQAATFENTNRGVIKDEDNAWQAVVADAKAAIGEKAPKPKASSAAA